MSAEPSLEHCEVPAPRVLVVDDDPLMVQLVSHHLMNAGMEVGSAGSAAEARTQLASAPYDLILLDVGLPDGDGVGLCQELKTDPTHRPLPVIFMTSRRQETEILRGFDAGGVDYVLKPFEPRVLIARVCTHTALSRLTQNLHTTLDARTESLRQAHRRMRQMDVELSLAEERERRRLAEQLHDSTIQQLVLARLLAESRPGGKRLGHLQGLLDSSIGQLRGLVFELSPPILYQGGLVPALQWLADDLAARWSLGFGCRVEAEVPALPDDLRVTLFQAARELMINVCKHARATRAEVLIGGDRDAVCLTVSDDGVGLVEQLSAEAMPSPSRGGFGLFSLRSRIGLLGGSVGLEQRAGGGIRVSLRVPLRSKEGG